MRARSASSRAWKTMTSSMRLRNSGRKVSPQRLGDLRLHPLVACSSRGLARGRRHELRADVAGHDEDGVLEVDRAALAVGQAAVVEDLEQDVEDVRVGLLDLVEQDHLVRPAADRLGELAALLVADVAGRRADQPATRRTSPCTRSCRCGSWPCSSSNRNCRQRPGQLGLAHAGGAQEDERADGPPRVLEPGARAPHGVGDGRDGLVLADHALVQPLLHVDAAWPARPPSGASPGCPSRRPRCGRCRPRRPPP